MCGRVRLKKKVYRWNLMICYMLQRLSQVFFFLKHITDKEFGLLDLSDFKLVQSFWAWTLAVNSLTDLPTLWFFFQLKLALKYLSNKYFSDSNNTFSKNNNNYNTNINNNNCELSFTNMLSSKWIMKTVIRFVHYSKL